MYWSTNEVYRGYHGNPTVWTDEFGWALYLILVRPWGKELVIL